MARRELVDSCDDYLELKPHHASLLDLVRVLFSSHKSLSRAKFVETSDANHLKSLELRWIVFISLLVQKLLLYLKKPVARTGYVIEMGLNLLSSNGGFCQLLLNIVKDGNVGLVQLLEWDSLLYVVYETNDSGYVDDQNLYSTNAFMFKDTTSNPNLIVVAFRGTEPFDLDQWRTDVDFSWYELHGVGRIHSGFLKALGAQKKTGWPKDIIDEGLGRQYAYYTLRQKLKEELEKDKNVNFILTGHSLGAALAILFVAGLVLHEEEELLEGLDWVYTYGQPRVGNEQFANWMGEKMRIYDVKYLRYVYSTDLVPRVPYDDQAGTLYKHFGPCLWVNSFYGGKVVWEEPDKNYFSLLWAIPKILNAVWELIRGFTLPYIYGPVYQESCVMKLVRVFGMFIPGLAAHCPQDYDNATRLGSFPPEILDQQVLNEATKSRTPFHGSVLEPSDQDSAAAPAKLRHSMLNVLKMFPSDSDYQHQCSTQAIMFKDTTSNPNLIVVAFRGTEPFDSDQWRTNIDISWYQLKGAAGRIHSGFLRALGLQKKTGWPKYMIEEGSGRQYAYYALKQKLREELKKEKNVKFILTGHGLGGALAILFAAGLVLHEEKELLESLDWVYTFGQPMVGNEQFGNWMWEKMRIYDVKYLRYVYCNDVVPRLPYDDQTRIFLYKHFGPCLYVNSFYRGKVMREEPNENYFSLLWAIPKNQNAVWELVRSLILPYMCGLDYKEIWFMTLVRLFGTLIPGLAAHCPQDYDIAIRIGFFPSESILAQQVVNGNHV
ncbi:hypothetical protein RHMOL_Rhmol06G0063400 [Rhododendron molle]|uniref:Uncharacterized protein n=2 Tax=Rhododendron molle TaxID=49168 RepID=A0ACC0N9P8_RHOML|nr:hypothetical protein RHMOL_Rhmol06G0063400 [Rhododendron molle]KAI8549930.1 hypothetical protein RHMOL_Rhmol06G0063400 [Rhododendron molle]